MQQKGRLERFEAREGLDLSLLVLKIEEGSHQPKNMVAPRNWKWRLGSSQRKTGPSVVQSMLT